MRFKLKIEGGRRSSLPTSLPILLTSGVIFHSQSNVCCTLLFFAFYRALLCHKMSVNLTSFREQHCCEYWNIGCCMCTCSSQMSFQYIGVRSLSFRDLLLTVGTGLGSLFFFDMRTCSFLAHRDTDQMLCYRSGKGWLVRNDTDLSILRTLSGTLDQIGMQDNSYLRC